MKPLPDDRLVVMLVEDDMLLRKLFTSVLERDGYEVIVAKNAHEAKDTAMKLSKPPAAVVCDYNLPDEDGLELHAWLQSRKLISPAYVLISGSLHHKIVPNVRFLAKPFKPDQLCAVIRDAIHGEAALNDHEESA
ncbi:MAG TPA: response regulator [Opitutaceae bacterium]|nr:response regulator [Opitutaceae bacterium]